MPAELAMTVVVVAFDGCVLDRTGDPLELAVRPRMIDPGEAVFDAVLTAKHSEHVRHGASGSGGKSAAEARLFHLATVFGLIP